MIAMDMTLGDQQEQFMRMLPLLIMYAHYLGYEVRGGHLRRCDTCPVGRKNSVHRHSLAIDLNLFTAGGNFLTDGTGHDKLHDFWDMLGGAPRITEDLNHYSLAWKGAW